MPDGNHLPDFHWGDDDDSPFIDWAAVVTRSEPVFRVSRLLR